MRMRQLKRLAVFGPLVIVGIWELVHVSFHPDLLLWPGRILLDGVLLGGALAFYWGVFRLIAQMQETLKQKNRELKSLYAAGLDVSSELTLEPVLQKVVDLARELVDGRYGALAVIDDSDRIRSFMTSGITPEERARIGDPPRGQGLLGVVLREGERLRLAEMQRDSRFEGFPPHHPQMKSLLGVPIVCRGPFRGNLYIADKQRGAVFTADNEKTLARFAGQAAAAIDNAHLHRRVRDLAAAEERLRIAHEMHDGLAQVLAYVNAKGLAVRESLRQGHANHAGVLLDQLTHAARDAYEDVREGILELRTSAKRQESLTTLVNEYLGRWAEQSGIATELLTEDDLELAPAAEFQVVRILQEALANIRKHSGAQGARVALRREDGHIVLQVDDDGRGFDPGRLPRGEFPRFGLSTMRERAESIGADFRLESSVGRGTKLRLQVPAASPAVPREE